MGGDLPARPANKRRRPSFIVQALKAPDSGNLDRIQVVKVWLEGTGYKEKIFNVALSGGRHPDPRTGAVAPVGNTVDLDKRHLHQHHRGGRAERRVDRSGVRRRQGRRLLRPGAGDPDAALDDPAGRQAPPAVADQAGRHNPGTGVGLADLVHADASRRQTEPAHSRALPPQRVQGIL